MKEIWKDIEGYEGLYQVSTKGRVKSLEREYYHSNGHKMVLVKISETIMRDSEKNGYRKIALSKENHKAYFHIHRLVAEAFIPNPNNLPDINHIDEDRNNNSVDNLEWCDAKYNSNYGTHHKKISEAKRKKGIIHNFAVAQLSLDGKEIARYYSVCAAAKATNIDQSSIWKVSNGKIHKTGGYRWKYVDP